MGRRAGSADLPLHGGRVPAWLGQRMTRLGAVITQAIVLEYGRDELLRRLAHPFWFQSFGAVMGMDWHSSGITTSVIGGYSKSRFIAVRWLHAYRQHEELHPRNFFSIHFGVLQQGQLFRL